MEDGDDDLLGGDSSYAANTGNEEMMGFESSFPAIDTTNEVSLVRFSNHTNVASSSPTAHSLTYTSCTR